MDPERYADQPPKRNPEDSRQSSGMEAAPHDTHARDAHPKDAHPRDAHAKAELASRSVMHPESFDPEWRYYHGAWGG